MDVKDSMVYKSVSLRNLDGPQVPLLKTYKEADTQLQISPVVRKKRMCSLLSKDWESLDENILREIFSRIPVVDLFLNVSSVCQSWEAISWEVLFWSRTVFDMSATGAGFGGVDMSTVLYLGKPKPTPSAFFGELELDSPEEYNKMATNLMRKLRRIMEGNNVYGYSLESWRLSIQTIILPYDLEVSDAHLLYIAERTPCLQHLLLLCPSKITVTGFIKAIKNWKHVKGLHLGALDDDIFPQFIQEIGRYCQELESLHIHHIGFIINKANVMVIGKSLPRLKKLEFQSGNLHESGVSILYRLFLQMEEVHFNCCPFVDQCGLPKDHCIENFRLSWTVVDQKPLWEVKHVPILPIDVERFNQWEGKPFPGEYLLTPEHLQSCQRMLESTYFTWLYGSFAGDYLALVEKLKKTRMKRSNC